MQNNKLPFAKLDLLIRGEVYFLRVLKWSSYFFVMQILGSLVLGTSARFSNGFSVQIKLNVANDKFKISSPKTTLNVLGLNFE